MGGTSRYLGSRSIAWAAFSIFGLWGLGYDGMNEVHGRIMDIMMFGVSGWEGKGRGGKGSRGSGM